MNFSLACLPAWLPLLLYVDRVCLLPIDYYSYYYDYTIIVASTSASHSFTYIVFPFCWFPIFSFCIDFHRFITTVSHTHTHKIIRKSIFSTFKLISNSDYHMCVCAWGYTCALHRFTYFFSLSSICIHWCVLCSGLWIESSNKRKYELVLKL